MKKRENINLRRWEIKMVTCNLCRKNKVIADMQFPFRYICKDCWEKMKITINGEKVEKELVY